MPAGAAGTIHWSVGDLDHVAPTFSKDNALTILENRIPHNKIQQQHKNNKKQEQQQQNTNPVIVGLENVTHCFPNFLQRQSNEIVPIQAYNKLQTSDRTSQTHLVSSVSFFQGLSSPFLLCKLANSTDAC